MRHALFVALFGFAIAGREIALESPAGHQLFFKPAELWLEPVLGWLSKSW